MSTDRITLTDNTTIGPEEIPDIIIITVIVQDQVQWTEDLVVDPEEEGRESWFWNNMLIWWDTNY